ncbi:MAG TPA: hypothetical protein VFJ48_10010 [Casimicrobiaceae bacterium]|nr:hypothetical protein [Casimicrobiaceae bacterium]
MKRTLIALAAAGVLASGGALAGTTQITGDFGTAAVVPVQYSNGPQYSNGSRWDDRSVNVNERESRIRARIERGIRDGRITRGEARGLYRELASIEATEHAYKSDGRLSYRESAELNRRLDRLADNVRVQVRDEERRYSYNQ